MNEPEAIFDDLQQHVDELHAGIDRANLPPASMWTSVRAQVKSGKLEEEKPLMNSIVTQPNVLIPPTPVRHSVEKGFRHHLSVAASLAIVLTVALAGWFATMQINQPNGSNGQFGLFGQSDQSATCDVEPMTVDEVIQRLEQPIGTNEDGESYPVWFHDEMTRRVLWNTDSPVPPHNYIDQTLIDSFQNAPDEESFAIATEQMNDFLACAQTGTMGQAFWYIRPFELHRIVMTDLPLYRDEAAVRTAVEQLLPLPATGLVGYGDVAFTDPAFTFQANSNIADAAASNTVSPTRFGASEAILIGVTVTDADGEIVFQNDYRGATNPAGPLKTTDWMRVIMAKSLIDEQWYVLAIISQ